MKGTSLMLHLYHGRGSAISISLPPEELVEAENRSILVPIKHLQVILFDFFILLQSYNYNFRKE